MLRPCGKQDRGRIYNTFFFGFLGLTTQQLGSIHSHKMSQVFIWALGKPCFFRKPASVFEKGAVFMTSTGKKTKIAKQDSHVFRLFPLHNCSNSSRGFQGSTKAAAISRRVWNVCWIPLASIRTVSSDTSNEGDFLGDGRCGVLHHLGVDEDFEPPKVEADGR